MDSKRTSPIMLLSPDNPVGLTLACIGVAVFAASGALAAIRQQMDLIGVLTLAVVTSIGGGTLRDLLIDSGPVFWIHEPFYIWIGALTGLFVFIWQPTLKNEPKSLLISDAIGLALVTWAGCEKTYMMELPGTAVLLMGVFTGTAGGLIRDIISNQVPAILLPGQLYATASFMGAVVFLAGMEFGVPDTWTAGLSIATTLSLRLAAIRWGISLAFLQKRNPSKPVTCEVE